MKIRSKPAVVPCEMDAVLRGRISDLAETLKTEAHKLGSHGLTEQEFYDSGLFRGAIEQLRGEFIASMSEKRQFVRQVLNYMQDQRAIKDWQPAGDANRHDYVIDLNDGRKAAIELKGCLDGNNTNIFERPPHVHEFVIWSVCTNAGADPRHNVWSGVHTRLSAEIISREERVDGLIVWDYVCGSIGRPCPKVLAGAPVTTVGPYKLPPPCIYMFPATVPSPRNNPKPPAQDINHVGVLKAFYDCFGCSPRSLNYVEWEVGYSGVNTVRSTTIKREGVITRQSKPTAIKRK